MEQNYKICYPCNYIALCRRLKKKGKKKRLCSNFPPCFICTLLTTVTGALIMPRWLRSCGWLVSFSSQGMLYNYQHPSWLPVSWCFFITSSIITASLWTSALQAMHRGSQHLSLDVPSHSDLRALAFGLYLICLPEVLSRKSLRNAINTLDLQTKENFALSLLSLFPDYCLALRFHNFYS